MVVNPTWEEVSQDFQRDGSWRDIYIFDTTVDDWQALLDYLRDREMVTWFTIDGEPAVPMSDARAIFALRDTVAPSIGFRAAGLDLACHFFCEEEIEFDFVPTDVTAKSWPDFVAWLREIATRFKRDIVVTPENWSHVDIIRISPNTCGLLYFPPDAD